jgi:hypothetical protein
MAIWMVTRRKSESIAFSYGILVLNSRLVHPEICREGALHIHFRLQGGRWAHGGRQLDFEPQVQREANSEPPVLYENGPSVSISVAVTRDISQLHC